jgi:2'-5' RNA ligase
MVEFSTSFEAAWEQFQALGSLRLAGETTDADLSHGRAPMLAFLIRIEDRAVREYAEAVLDRLADIPGIEPHPPEFWHITVKAAGFQVIKRVREDDVLRQDVGRLGKEAVALLATHPAYDAQIGPPNGFPDVIFLEVRDDGATRALNRALAEGLDGVAAYPTDGPSFLPHMTIARFTSSEGLDQLRAALTELRAGAPGPRFPIRRVEFVKAWLSEETPDIETLASYPLAAS